MTKLYDKVLETRKNSMKETDFKCFFLQFFVIFSLFFSVLAASEAY